MTVINYQAAIFQQLTSYEGFIDSRTYRNWQPPTITKPLNFDLVNRNLEFLLSCRVIGRGATVVFEAELVSVFELAGHVKCDDQRTIKPVSTNASTDTDPTFNLITGSPFELTMPSICITAGAT